MNLLTGKCCITGRQAILGKFALRHVALFILLGTRFVSHVRVIFHGHHDTRLMSSSLGDKVCELQYARDASELLNSTRQVAITTAKLFLFCKKYSQNDSLYIKKAEKYHIFTIISIFSPFCIVEPVP